MLPLALRKKDIDVTFFVILGIDVTDGDALESTDEFMQQVNLNNPDAVMIAVGNKVDLVDQRKIDLEDAKNFFSSLTPPLPFYETSARTGEGVQELFDEAVRQWMEKHGHNDNPEDDPEDDGQRRCIIC